MDETGEDGHLDEDSEEDDHVGGRQEGVFDGDVIGDHEGQ